MIEKQERAPTLDSLFPLQLPRSIPPFNLAPLYISPWQLHCVCVYVCESHGSSATASLRDSRHVQMVFVLVPNEVPDTESRDLIGHIDLRVLVGEKLSSPAMFGHLQMYEPVEKCEEVAS